MKDKIEVQFITEDRIGAVLVKKSNNYEYWYDYFECEECGELEITQLNIRIGNVLYENVVGIFVNGVSVACNCPDGFAEITELDY
jgi:hypothetical protein